MTIEEMYRRVKSITRQLGLRDSLYVVWAYSQYLQVNEFELPRDIEAAPRFLNAEMPRQILAEWTVEQITREVIRYADEEPRNGRSLSQWGTLAEVANTLRDLEGAIYRDLVGGERIQLELMRIAHRQFVWQQFRYGWVPIIRYYKLFNTPAIIALAQQTMGLTIDEIYLIGLAYLGTFSDHPRATLAVNVEIPGLTRQHFDRFLAFTSLSRNSLSNKLRAEHALNESFAYQYSSLREFPLVQISYRGVDEIACPIPTLLFWRITTGLYYSLRNVPGFSDAFGASFEVHVGEILRQCITSAEMTVIEQEEYHVRLNRKHTVDWILQQGDEGALFLECKIKRLTWASKIGISDLSALEQDIGKLAEAVIQVYKTISDYRAGHYPQLRYVERRRIYPVIVTLEDWYLFGGEMLGRLDAAVRKVMTEAALPLEWLDEMPYSITSVHEIGKVAGVVNTVGVIPFISGKMNDPEFRNAAYGAYCNNRYSDEVRSLSHLFRDEFDAMFADLPRAR
jgi:hypothetical protein